MYKKMGRTFPWDGDLYIKPTEAANYLNVTNKDLYNWRKNETGPTFIKYENGPVMYSFASVKRFAAKLPKKPNPPIKPLDIY